ncbi:hypothetical protein B0T21DRAFT_412116 [Apiosordaria backusii]|uniref:Glutamyl-tRNA synthetase n=1 Tax=Apiosordaria backusii TaxID=314023 RepID=A0AA40BJP7_9PEZI|nr:hypothetical protein B0T21DRAFT_412116 [Apiosordaria backusii]
MTSLNPVPSNYETALKLIDEAHAQDPRKGPNDVPYELHYAQKMTRWLAQRKPDASPALQLACRAQHFRRWEIPRSTYPMTRPGYLTWRAKQKSVAAAQLSELLASPQIQPALAPEEIERVTALVRKEDLKSNEETQVLEDVACLVFLDDQFDDFESKPEIDEAKIVSILQKTWGKMSEEGRALALGMDLSERAKMLVGKALA